MEAVLHGGLTLRETLAMLAEAEREAVSRYRCGSPCRFVRSIDVLVHIMLPELVENAMPRLARYLRRTSPRWGRSWREW